MQWTSDAPTEAGWWWHKQPGFMEMVRITKSPYWVDGEPLDAWFHGNEYDADPFCIDGEWYGPILPPE